MPATPQVTTPTKQDATPTNVNENEKAKEVIPEGDEEDGKEEGSEEVDGGEGDKEDGTEKEGEEDEVKAQAPTQPQDTPTDKVRIWLCKLIV